MSDELAKLQKAYKKEKKKFETKCDLIERDVMTHEKQG